METMDKFCEQFNAEIPDTWNYRNLATAFKLEYDSFAQDPQVSLTSPTEKVFEWLQCSWPEFPAYFIIISIADIGRIDVLKALRKFFPGEFRLKWVIILIIYFLNFDKLFYLYVKDKLLKSDNNESLSFRCPV